MNRFYLKTAILLIYLPACLAILPEKSFCQLIASGDTTICEEGSAQLYASGGGASYYWTSYPNDPSLLIPQQQNPIVSPQVSTMYVVQSNIATGNLILNGPFELGVMGFNSDYVNNQVSIVDEGTYAVVTDAHTVHPDFFCNQDHTSGHGKFMAVNGAGVANVKVWYLTLTNVQPEARYEFSTWITSLHPTNPATLQFSINGQLMGQPFQAYPYTCDWYQFFYIWDADTNHQATISIVNQNTILSGNDFALDDISFATVLVYYDTVWVTVLPQFDSPFDLPSAACAEEAITVSYTGNAPDTADFHWNFDGGTVLSGSGPGPYQISYSSQGNPSISLWVDGEGCASDTTSRELAIGESPSVNLYADNTILPYGSSTFLHGSYTGGLGPFTYAWSPPGLLVDPNTLDPQTLALQYTTSFILAVTDQAAGCTGYDTVIIQVAGGPLGVNVSASPDEICPGGQSVLSAQGLGGTENYTYLWTSNPPGFTSDLPTVTVQPTTTTQYTVTINDGLSEISESVTVTIDPNPVANAGADNTIPYGTFTNLQGTGSGGSGSYSYHWEPSSSVLYPNSSNTQTINLTGTTIFTLVVTDLETGCISQSDEVVIQIDGGPLAVLISSDKPSVCKGDTAILTAYASGGNQGEYTYSWSDNLGNSYPPTPQITVSPSGTITFHVIVNDGFNLIEDYYSLEVFPSAEFSWTGGQDLIMACPYDSIILKPDPNPADWNYLWSNGSVDDQISVRASGIGFSSQTYSLLATTQNGCQFSRSITVIFDFSQCSGITETNPVKPVRVMPNPSNGKFRVFLDDPHDFTGIFVYGPLGGKVFEKNINGVDDEIDLDLEDLPAGLYVLCIRGSSRLFTEKLIIRP
jgi:hypothetical protein